MPIRRDWTDQGDARGRGDLGRDRMRCWAVAQYCYRAWATDPCGQRAAGVPKTSRPQEEEPNREALPAGHPVTWGLLTEDTALEGTPCRPPGDSRRRWGSAMSAAAGEGRGAGGAVRGGRADIAGAAPSRGHSPRPRLARYDIIHDAIEASGSQASEMRAPHPEAAAIDRMDETFSWLRLIPDERFVLRRIVAPRALINPITGRNLFPWRRLKAVLRADHKSVQRWHKDGLGLILAGAVGSAAG